MKQGKLAVDLNRVLVEYQFKVAELDKQLTIMSVYIQQLEEKIDQLEAPQVQPKVEE